MWTIYRVTSGAVMNQRLHLKMARPDNVNYYRSGTKNADRQVITWEDEETGEVKVHIVELNQRRIRTLEWPGDEVDDGEEIRADN
jgi:hypothetical protein